MAGGDSARGGWEWGGRRCGVRRRTWCLLRGPPSGVRLNACGRLSMGPTTDNRSERSEACVCDDC